MSFAQEMKEFIAGFEAGERIQDRWAGRKMEERKQGYYEGLSGAKFEEEKYRYRNPNDEYSLSPEERELRDAKFPGEQSGGQGVGGNGEVKARAVSVYSYMVNEKGVPPAMAYAMLGNAGHESKFDHNIVNPDPKEKSFGLFQFNRVAGEGIPYNQWLQTGNGKGRQANDPKAQVDFVLERMQGPYRNVWNAMQQEPDLAKRVALFQNGYEQPKDRTGTLASRIGWAKTLEGWTGGGQGGAAAPQAKPQAKPLDPVKEPSQLAPTASGTKMSSLDPSLTQTDPADERLLVDPAPDWSMDDRTKITLSNRGGAIPDYRKGGKVEEEEDGSRYDPKAYVHREGRGFEDRMDVGSYFREQQPKKSALPPKKADIPKGREAQGPAPDDYPEEPRGRPQPTPLPPGQPPEQPAPDFALPPPEPPGPLWPSLGRGPTGPAPHPATLQESQRPPGMANPLPPVRKPGPPAPPVQGLDAGAPAMPSPTMGPTSVAELYQGMEGIESIQPIMYDENGNPQQSAVRAMAARGGAIPSYAEGGKVSDEYLNSRQAEEPLLGGESPVVHRPIEMNRGGAIPRYADGGGFQGGGYDPTAVTSRPGRGSEEVMDPTSYFQEEQPNPEVVQQARKRLVARQKAYTQVKRKSQPARGGEMDQPLHKQDQPTDQNNEGSHLARTQSPPVDEANNLARRPALPPADPTNEASHLARTPPQPMGPPAPAPYPDEAQRRPNPAAAEQLQMQRPTSGGQAVAQAIPPPAPGDELTTGSVTPPAPTPAPTQALPPPGGDPTRSLTGPMPGTPPPAQPRPPETPATVGPSGADQTTRGAAGEAAPEAKPETKTDPGTQKLNALGGKPGEVAHQVLAAQNKLVQANPGKDPGQVLQQEAAKEQEVVAIRQKSDPEGKLDLESQNIKMLLDLADFYHSIGKPKLAESTMARLGLYYRNQTMMAGALAMAAIKHGNMDHALQALQRAHAYVPDGMTVDYRKEGDGRFSYRLIDSSSGQMTDWAEATPQMISGMAQKAATGMAYFELMMDAAGKRGGGGKGADIKAPKDGKAPTDKQLENEEDDTYWANRQNQFAQDAARETDPAKKELLTARANAVQYDRWAERNAKNSKAAPNMTDADTLAALGDIKDEKVKSLFRQHAADLRKYNPTMTGEQAVSMVRLLSQKPTSMKENVEKSKDGRAYEVRGFGPTFMTFDLMARIGNLSHDLKAGTPR